MTTAIAPLDEGQLVAQPRPVVTYISSRQDLRLTKTARRWIRNSATGEVIGESPGQTLRFHTFIDPERKQRAIDGGLNEREAQAAARFGRVDIPTEGEIELEHGIRADAGEILAWLGRHRLLDDQIEGFWRAVTKIPPVSQEELDRIVQAATGHDVQTLERIVEQERAGWNRAQVITTAQGSLERIAKAQAELRADVESKTAKKKAGA